ncbi:MAG TPA: 30S ribosome-binding factor RbfA [Solirubrobacteraceae bacterium]|nr:30S ribosome-binding factor RbfA [Solirubrobacteraceae bacterium]
MRGGRMRRVDEAMRMVLSDAIATDLKDPRIGFVTVTAVKTSPDLRHARVYVSVLGSEDERAASIEGLRSAHGYLQRRLAGELTLKHTPTLTFEYDDSVDRGMRITELLDQVGDRDSQASQSDLEVAPDDPQGEDA